MSERSAPVLVLGASGETGRRVVQRLIDYDLAARALVRRPEHVNQLLGSGVELIIGDALDDHALHQAIVGARAVISVLGSRSITDLAKIERIEVDAVIKLIQQATAAGIDQIVLCSSMGAETPDRLPPLADVLRANRRAEQALEASGVGYTIVRPGGLTNDAGGDVTIARSLPVGGRISRDDLAEVLVQAVLQPGARNRIVEVINQPDAGPADRLDLFVES